ncbi:hypothetical protein Poly24_43950 [Rosistilla carotiformis]|uniref:EamA-like transporter family protein n=1 Tax=Rosistilla carotiformis TaxID=2528017 RepID=A0A518JYQ8_9BACT|nr:hypothetical protein [Rosistilla carotiformis]QDV70669.1 hypothetical protein Poly24_43950 [Rosistilla carotiformis]
MKIFLPVLFALCTAMCWGMYGPTIGNAQSKSWSPFKPYVFIGIAYVVLAIIGGLIAMRLKGDTFSYSGEHFAPAKWGFLAGCLGALGALFLTSAMMTSKGNALLVMPIVFGGAVSVTALYSTWRLWGHTQISPALWGGIAMVVVGVIVVATNTPHGHAAAKPSPTVSHENAAAEGNESPSAEAAGETSPAADSNS